MNQILLVLKREYVTRVKKKSFLLATLLTPLILPAIIFVIAYFATRDKENRDEQILVLDESGYFTDVFDQGGYTFENITGNLNEAKETYADKGAFGLLYIPEIDLSDPSVRRFEGFQFYSKSNTGFGTLDRFEGAIRGRLEDLKLERSGLDPTVIANLQARVSLETYNLTDAGEATASNSGVSFGVGYVTGFLIYMFIFVYGSQIMQSVLDEKSSRIVEVIVSSVRPFQLMMGKVLGVGAVGFTQLLIWIVLIATLSTIGVGILAGGSDAMMDAASQQMPDTEMSMTDQQELAENIRTMVASIPVVKIVLCFLFYFVGAYLLYGALYAAIGASVDSLQDAQQFMFPIILPILAAIMAMFFVLEDPNSGLAVTLSMIPFTSPIIMMARIPFGVPDWQLALSMLFLIGGFVGTIWVAGRIYRIGILMYGVKVNWMTMKKWFTMKV